MFVAVCDQNFGKSTPRCSKAGPSRPGMIASRVSHSISSNGSRPGIVKKRLTPSLAPSSTTVFTTSSAVVSVLCACSTLAIVPPGILVVGRFPTAPPAADPADGERDRRPRIGRKRKWLLRLVRAEDHDEGNPRILGRDAAVKRSHGRDVGVVCEAFCFALPTAPEQDDRADVVEVRRVRRDGVAV